MVESSDILPYPANTLEQTGKWWASYYKRTCLTIGESRTLR